MGTLKNIGESIECNGSNVAARKISDKPTAIKLDDVRGTLFKYKTNIRCLAAITDPLDDNDKHRINENSSVEVGDHIDAEIVEIYTKKRVKFDVVSNFSHVHGIQGSQVSCFTYAKIITPWRFILEKALSASATTKLLDK